MRVLVISAALIAAGLLTGASSVGAPTAPPGADAYLICLDGGRTISARCTVLPGRLSNDQGNCDCPGGLRPVAAPVCAAGETPPSESRALRIARRTAARDGSLIGDQFEGAAMCVTARTRR